MGSIQASLGLYLVFYMFVYVVSMWVLCRFYLGFMFGFIRVFCWLLFCFYVGFDVGLIRVLVGCHAYFGLI